MGVPYKFDAEYKDWIQEIKSKIQSTQIKAAIAVNSTLILFYWELGKMISEKENVWGSKLLEKLSTDLKSEFPEMKGFSVTNLKYCKLFYSFFQINPHAVDEIEISQQAVDEMQNTYLKQVTLIPWGHNVLIFTKSKNREEAQFYIQETIINNWSRDVLALQIKTDLYKRQGKGVTNFKRTLPEPLSDLAQQTLKDPYIFDFLTMSKPYHEKDIEKQLLANVTKFLLELGKGFAFIGRQYYINVGETDYYIDLLFYHVKLKCYVVIELKNTKFIPEYAGKLNFYLSAVDSLIKSESDNPTIGILLCRDKNNFETEFALRDINKPLGISEFQLTEILPEELKSSLPTIEEIEQELSTKE
jgi:predicted nuclease of restriction endonuclease-like (RecB) superfamily